MILAPFGLAGTLINQNNNGCNGTNNPSNDAGAVRLLDAWQHFYPVTNVGGSEPTTVEVSVGGVRMRYPARYVLLTEMDDGEPPTSRAPSQPHTTQYLPPRPSAALSYRTIVDLSIGQQVYKNTYN